MAAEVAAALLRVDNPAKLDRICSMSGRVFFLIGMLHMQLPIKRMLYNRRKELPMEDMRKIGRGTEQYTKPQMEIIEMPDKAIVTATSCSAVCPCENAFSIPIPCTSDKS